MIVGVLGGGQLGRMLALAGYPLGLRFRFLEPMPHAPAGMLAEVRQGAYEDPRVLEEFAAGLDRITYEFESIPVQAVRALAKQVPVYPPPEALEAAQDRLNEKTLFQRLGIPVPPFAAVNSREDLDAAIARVGLPAVLKTRRFGYDGKGQFVLREPADAARAWQMLGNMPLLLEGFVTFDREVSILAVRGASGATAFYPLVENHHRDGILRLSLAPAPNRTRGLQELAERHASALLDALRYVGVLAIEFFEKDGNLLANEMAPRVHNSGHWTIEGAETSQFENHLRAILDLPLGPARAVGHSAMINLIGTVPDLKDIFSVPDAHLHLYGKSPRPGRKLGHVTVWVQREAEVEQRVQQLRGVMGGD
jgi:5-(carboxyamino)imidazole ribonucleotide synthase